MARFYSNENFDRSAVEKLRELGQIYSPHLKQVGLI